MVFVSMLGASEPADGSVDQQVAGDAAPEVEAAPPPPAAVDASVATVPADAGAAQPAAPDASKIDMLHEAFVHLHADYPDAVVELRSYVDDGEWSVACRAPCDRVLRVEGMDVRVAARGMTTSNPFRVDPGRGTANLKVVGGSARSKAIGTAGFAGGIPVALLGMGLWGYGRVEDQAALRTAGLVTLAVGAVLVLGSLPFLSAGGTRVRDAKGKTIAASFSPPRL